MLLKWHINAYTYVRLCVKNAYADFLNQLENVCGFRITKMNLFIFWQFLSIIF